MVRSFLPAVWLIVLAMLVFRTSQVGGEEQVVKIGGVRNITVAVSEAGEKYLLRVEMLPVKAFDPVTNEKLNLQKARAAAMQALSKHLKLAKNTRFGVRKLEVENTDSASDHFRLSLSLPRDGISVIPLNGEGGESKSVRGADAAPSVAKETVAKDTVAAPQKIEWVADAPVSEEAFLTRAADYLDTMKRLQGDLLNEVRTASGKARQQSEFYSAVADLEERMERMSEAMLAEINADKLLLSVEQEELRTAVGEHRSKVLKELGAAVKKFDERQKKTKKVPVK